MKDTQVKIILVIIIAISLITNFVSFGKIKKLKNEVAQANQLVEQKDAEVKTLIGQMQAKQDELDGVKKQLADTNTRLLAAQKQLGSVKQEIEKVSQKIGASKTAPVAPKK